MARLDPEASLRTAQKFGRPCLSCSHVTRKWSVPRQIKCDTCLAGENQIYVPIKAKKTWKR